MEFHEIANAFPLIDGSEFDELCRDVSANGLLEPIWTYQGKILDGRNRYRACQAVGVNPQYREYTGDNPLNFVISLNLKRRHLNESQRAVIAAKLANMTKRDAGRIGGKSNKEATVNLQLLKNGKMEVSTAAELLNVSPRLVATVKAIEKSAPDLIEKINRGEMTAHEAQKKIKEAERQKIRYEMAVRAVEIQPSDKWKVIHGDMTTVKLNRQYDFIITDPPYPKEYLHLWDELGRRAVEWLKDGGLLIAMSGQSYVNEIYKMLDKHLKYYWTASYLTPGQPTPLRQVNVNSTWKPLLIYSKGKYTGKIFGDVFVSEGNDKSLHKWGQSESGMTSIIKGIVLPGQSILDPFCGAGTTLVAAIKHNCFATGIELDEQNVNIAKGRLAEL